MKPNDGGGRNPFDLLGLARTAAPTEVKPAFRKLAKLYHPDIAGTGDERRFRALIWAVGQLESAEGWARWGTIQRRPPPTAERKPPTPPPTTRVSPIPSTEPRRTRKSPLGPDDVAGPPPRAAGPREAVSRAARRAAERQNRKEEEQEKAAARRQPPPPPEASSTSSGPSRYSQRRDEYEGADSDWRWEDIPDEVISPPWEPPTSRYPRRESKMKKGPSYDGWLDSWVMD